MTVSKGIGVSNIVLNLFTIRTRLIAAEEHLKELEYSSLLHPVVVDGRSTIEGQKA